MEVSDPGPGLVGSHLQSKSSEGCTQGSRVGRPIAAVGIHMTCACVCLNKSNEGHDNCSCRHTHVWCKKILEVLSILNTFAEHTDMCVAEEVN